jgi:uncharacterized protein (TIGR00251 family)
VSPLLRVHVHPGARRESLRGIRPDGALKVEVCAPPEGGQANDAVSALLAEALGIGKRRVTVVRGRTSRAKVLEIEGLTGDELGRRIRHALETGRTDAE